MRFYAALTAVGLYLAASGSAAAGTPRYLNDEEKTEIARAVSSGLKDPTSPLFLWPMHSGDPVLYCGLVNAKNSYGGYVGFTPYMVFLISSPGAPAKAVFYKAGNGDMESPQTLSIAETCWSKGYDFSTAGK